MRKIFFLILILFSSSLNLKAQNLFHGASGLAHGVPNFCLSDTTSPPNSIIHLIEVNKSYPCIGVHGELFIDVPISATTIFIYPGGFLTINSSIKWLDTPNNSKEDPEFYSNGLLEFGKLRINGEVKTPFLRLFAEIHSGEVIINLSAVPVNWNIGDEIAIPDSRQQRLGESQSEINYIKSINGSIVTLISSVQFSHLGVRNPDGTLQFLPHIANLTRSIVFSSENPNGNRYHILISQRADSDIRNLELRDCGRTTGELIDSTIFDVNENVITLGRNQIARYCIHFHHDFGPIIPQINGKQFTLDGIVINRFKKWGIAVHNSSWGLVQNSIIWNGQGAGIVQEDGSETNNQFIGNFACNINNSLTQLTNVEGETDQNFRLGSGFITRAPNAELRDNVFCDTREGINFITGAEEQGPSAFFQLANIPKFQGADTTAGANTTPIAMFLRPRGIVDNNEIYGIDVGLGCWICANFDTAKSPPFTNLKIWHFNPIPSNRSTSAGVFAKYSDVSFDNLTIINEGGMGRAFVHFNPGFGQCTCSILSELKNATIRGTAVGWQRTGQIGQSFAWYIKDSVFQNVVDFSLNNGGQTSTGARKIQGETLETPLFSWDNVKFQSLPGLPLRAIETTYIPVGSDIDLVARREFTLPVKSYQGIVGDDFNIFFLSPSPGEAIAPCMTIRVGIIGFTCSSLNSCSDYTNLAGIKRIVRIGEIIEGTNRIPQGARLTQLLAWGFKVEGFNDSPTTVHVKITCMGIKN